MSDGVVGSLTKQDLVAGSRPPSGVDMMESIAGIMPGNVVRRAVVVEVLYDMASISDDELEELKTLVGDTSKLTDSSNIESTVENLLITSPRNSILARVITHGEDHRKGLIGQGKSSEETLVKCQICYPFFPPHLGLPVKPGEVVWIINDNPDGDNTVSYWMCRVPGTDSCDDINYTHADRRFAPYITPAKTKTPKIDDEFKSYIFGFPNGNPPNAMTLRNPGDFEYIVQQSQAYRETFTPEPVPRFTKRPADLVLQGSNNTLISLGQDRGWTNKDSKAHRKDTSSATESNATKDDAEIKLQKEQSSGTIDIVTGRGRYTFPFFGASGDAPPKGSTSPLTVECTPPKKGREPYTEVNKNPAGQLYIEDTGLNEENYRSNPTEGDPNFYTDAARIYVSSATSVDKNFYIDQPGVNIPSPFDAIALSDEASLDGGNKLPAAVAVKSDQIRLIARKLERGKPYPKAPEIKGSIRLIKEGKPNEDLSAILMLEDGTVQISGKKIFLGRSVQDGMTSSDYGALGPGPGKGQPYIRFSDLKKLFTELWTAMDKFCDTALTHVTPGQGAPSPQLNQAAADFKSDLAKMKADTSTFDKLGSERIFGE